MTLPPQNVSIPGAGHDHPARTERAGPGTVAACPSCPRSRPSAGASQPILVGRRIVDGGAHPSAKFRSATEVIGATVDAVGRRGKYLLVGLDDGRSGSSSTSGMTGQFRLRAARRRPRPATSGPGGCSTTHQILEFRDVRRFGRIAVVGDDLSALPTLAALGPEPFDAAFTAERPVAPR